MGRGKKPGKGPQNNKDEPRRIRFEIEEDAEELFLKHLEQFKPDKPGAEEPKEPEKKASKTHKAMNVHELDLHGLRLDEAQQRVRDVLDDLREMAGMHKVKIITGKGVKELKLGLHIDPYGDFFCLMSAKDLSPRSINIPSPSVTGDGGSHQRPSLAYRLKMTEILTETLDVVFRRFMEARIAEDWWDNTWPAIQNWIDHRGHGETHLH